MLIHFGFCVDVSGIHVTMWHEIVIISCSSTICPQQETPYVVLNTEKDAKTLSLPYIKKINSKCSPGGTLLIEHTRM